jgi:hypothetical protein
MCILIFKSGRKTVLLIAIDGCCHAYRGSIWAEKKLVMLKRQLYFLEIITFPTKEN